MEKIYVFAPRTDSLFETMLTALSGKGYRIIRIGNLTGNDQGFCLVYITDKLIELFGSPEAANDTFSNSSLEFIPVISDENSRQQKEILTQYFYTPLEEKSIDKYVRRIDLIISMGSKKLKDWKRIRSLAMNWNLNDRSGKLLLGKEDLILANDLLRHPVHELLSESEELVRDIELASQRQLKRRHRVILVTGFIVGIAFLISGIFAAVSKKRSDDAALQARNQTNNTVADRLSAKALELMNVDPDLPWLLMDTAISISETQESMAAAHQITDNLVRHRSFRLPHVPSSLGYLGGNTYVIGYTDGEGVAVMDAVFGNIFYSDPAIENGWVCEISVGPRQQIFAANYRNSDGVPVGTKFYHWAEGAVECVASMEVPLGSFVWSGEKSIIAVVENKVCSIDILTGKVESNISIDQNGVPIAVAADEDTDNLFVAMGYGETCGIAVYSLSKGKVIGNIPVDGFGQMHYDSVTKTLLVDTGTTAVLINIADVKRGEEAAVANVQLSFARKLNALTSDQNGSFYFGSKVGAIFVLKPCEIKPMNVTYHTSDADGTLPWAYETGAAEIARSAVVAHLSEVHDIITMADGKWATVGRDSMIRIWDQAIYGQMKPLLDVLPRNYEARSPGRENAIHISLGKVNDSTAAAMSADGFSRVIFNRDTLGIVYNDYGWMQGQAKVAYDTGDAVVVRGAMGDYKISFVPVSSPIGEYKNASETASVHWFSALLEISQDGDVIFGVIPDGKERGAYCIERVDGENEWGYFDTASNMIYLKPLDDRDAMAINAEGEVFWFNGQRKKLFNDSIVLTAAAHISGNRFLSLDIDGNLWLSEDFGNAHMIGYYAPSNEGFSIRVSPGGNLAAVIGDYETRVFDIRTGEVISVLDNLFSQFSEYDSVSVHDVLFDSDDGGMVLVYSNGWITRFDFMSHDGVIDNIHESCPRRFQEEELAMFAVPD